MKRQKPEQENKAVKHVDFEQMLKQWPSQHLICEYKKQSGCGSHCFLSPSVLKLTRWIIPPHPFSPLLSDIMPLFYFPAHLCVCLIFLCQCIFLCTSLSEVLSLLVFFPVALRLFSFDLSHRITKVHLLYLLFYNLINLPFPC